MKTKKTADAKDRSQTAASSTASGAPWWVSSEPASRLCCALRSFMMPGLPKSAAMGLGGAPPFVRDTGMAAREGVSQRLIVAMEEDDAEEKSAGPALAARLSFSSSSGLLRLEDSFASRGVVGARRGVRGGSPCRGVCALPPARSLSGRDGPRDEDALFGYLMERQGCEQGGRRGGTFVAVDDPAVGT